MVYLIHFAEKYEHAGHYLGYAKHLDARIAHHRNGTGARLMQVVNEAGIDWQVVRTWEGGRDVERFLKAKKNAPYLCPVCCERAHLHGEIEGEVK